MPIVTLTGASGTGKTSYARELLKRPAWNLVPTYTTRAPRATDLPGECVYLTREDFAVAGLAQAFIWMTEHYGHRYAMRTSDIIDRIADAHLALMLVYASDIADLRKEFGTSLSSMMHVHLLSPSEKTLRERLTRRQQRGDRMDDEEIERRVAECRTWDVEALASDIPYLFVPSEIAIPDAANFIVRLIDRTFRKGVMS